MPGKVRFILAWHKIGVFIFTVNINDDGRRRFKSDNFNFPTLRKLYFSFTQSSLLRAFFYAKI